MYGDDAWGLAALGLGVLLVVFGALCLGLGYLVGCLV
jgi:hypothetical protein